MAQQPQLTSSVRFAGALLVAGTLLAGCGGEPAVRPADSARPATAAPQTGGPGLGAGDEAVPASRRTVAQAVGDRVEIFDAPGAASARWTLDSPNPRGVPVTFLVERAEGEWLYVHAPVRPNGSRGWVRRLDVVTSWTDHALRLDLTERRLTVRHRGHEVWTAPVAIGKAATPTPVGEFYLAELVELADPSGPYGAFAFGLSAFSEVLDQFNGGDPIIAIHGTNQPELIGQVVSNGCIRMSNDDVTRLADEVPLGTPVVVVE